MRKQIAALSCAAGLLLAMAVPAYAGAASDWSEGTLSETGKEIYQGFVEDLNNYESTLSADFSGSTQEALDAFGPVMELLKKQHPEFFWLKYSGQSCTVRGGTSTLTCSPVFNGEFSSGGSLSTQAVKDVQAKIDQTVSNIGTGGSTYETVKLFNDWLANQVAYTRDYSNSRVYEVSGSLVDQKSACEGYAKAFKLLCDRAGIECIVVSGRGTDYGMTWDHEWNYVQMDDGYWYLIDTTWNAISSNKQKWFLLGSGSTVGGLSLSSSHAKNDRGYPALAESNYSA